MLFIESNSDLEQLNKLLGSEQFVVHVYDLYKDTHPSQNKPLVMFLKQIKTNNYYCISFAHPDAIVASEKIIKLVMCSDSKKFIIDRKRLMYYEADLKNCVDIKSCMYFDKMINLSDEIDERCKDTRSIPIMKYLVHFKSICENIDIGSLESQTIKYEKELSTTLYHIEKNGMYVDNFDLGSKSLVSNENLVRTQYNILTPTSRPSNRFGNVNYAALNKKTGQRNCFKSRFGSEGTLVMMDYESYHLRLLGNFLNYKLPNTSIHEYLGKLYHGKDSLTEEEYDLSKKITFNLIYGGIDQDIKDNVPFMNEISKYVDKTYELFNSCGYVKTWFFDRKIQKCFFGDKINSYKVFNYILQASETERNCKIMQIVNEMLLNKKSKFILYTYDAFLFDVHSSEFDLMLNVREKMTTNNQYPVRTYIGKSYDKMKEV
tara:strand:- start:4888 stop:6180 length:1293 start_codon:yes stop_codon:yes gene_type:complete